MSPTSTLLIDEMIVPDLHASRATMSMDFAMLSVVGSKERSRAQWESLLGEAGLRLVSVHRYLVGLEASVIECRAA